MHILNNVYIINIKLQFWWKINCGLRIKSRLSGTSACVRKGHLQINLVVSSSMYLFFCFSDLKAASIASSHKVTLNPDQQPSSSCLLSWSQLVPGKDVKGTSSKNNESQFLQLVLKLKKNRNHTDVGTCPHHHHHHTGSSGGGGGVTGFCSSGCHGNGTLKQRPIMFLATLTLQLSTWTHQSSL